MEASSQPAAQMAVECNHPEWPQIAKLCPRLQAHIRIFPQEFRGETWYILRDQSSGRYLRFNRQAYYFIELIDGDHSVEEILALLQKRHGDEAPSADDICLVITQLLGVDAIKSGTGSAERMFNRYEQQRRQKRHRALLNPLAIKAPLFDPDALLDRIIPYTRSLLTRPAIVIWILITGYAGMLALVNFCQLSAAFNSSVLEPNNLVAMALLFIAIKAVHEFAHAIAVKGWGGEVHEMGITLLVLMPIPYVDASASAAFRAKEKRMLVSAAGIMAELFIASLALLIWLSVEPGFVKTMAFNTILIASISTLLFNANPLLRFDGYYILQDYAEIPNLYTRAGRYYIYLIQRYLFGLADARSPVTAHGERAWFAAYGALAFVYRIVILVAIVLYLASEFLIIGVVLGCWAVFMQIVMPMVKAVRFIASNPTIAPVRSRAKKVSLASLAGALLLFGVVPVPLSSQSEGVLWVSDQAEIFSATEGIVSEILIQPGQAVEAGTAIAVLSNPSLAAAIEVTRGKHSELSTEAATEHRDNWIKSQIIEHRAAAVKAELTLLEDRYGRRVIRSSTAGHFVPAQPHAMLGRYIRQGELVGYVVSPENLIVKAVVKQAHIGLLNRSEARAAIRFAERVDEVIEVNALRQTPAGNASLPSAALGAAGGGSLAVLASDESGRTAAEQTFKVELTLPPDLQPLAGIGERAYIRFYHGREPLAQQWWRKGRQLVLSQLDT